MVVTGGNRGNRVNSEVFEPKRLFPLVTSRLVIGETGRRHESAPLRVFFTVKHSQLTDFVNLRARRNPELDSLCTHRHPTACGLLATKATWCRSRDQSNFAAVATQS